MMTEVAAALIGRRQTKGEIVKVKITAGTVANGVPVIRGDIVEVGASEAAVLIGVGRAVEFHVEPLPDPAPVPVVEPEPEPEPDPEPVLDKPKRKRGRPRKKVTEDGD